MSHLDEYNVQLHRLITRLGMWLLFKCGIFKHISVINMLSITLSIRQQAITWINVYHDLWCNMASLRDCGKTTCHNFTVITSLTLSTTAATFRYLLKIMNYIPSWCIDVCFYAWVISMYFYTFMSLIRKWPQCIALAWCSRQCNW